MNKQIFILGAPRSGTTFLATLLEKTEYGEPFETHFITKYFKKLANYDNINEYKNYKNLLQDILGERAVMQWKLDIDYENFFKELGPEFTYAHLVNKICLKASQQKGFNSWGDKTPDYLADVDILCELFPDAKFIYIIRDGRDVTLSLLEKDWGPNNIYSCAKYWASLNRERSSIDRLRSTNNLYQLKYEDLLDNVEYHIKEIYSFLNQKYDDSELQKLASKVKPGNYNKWKKRMTPVQINIFDRTASNTLKRFNYEQSTEEKPLPTLRKAIYLAHNSFCQIRHLFILNVIDGIKIKFFGKEPFAE